MRILSVAAAIPTLARNNDDIVQCMRRESVETGSELVEQYIRLSRSLLNRAGSRNRFWRNRDEGETTRQLLLRAISNAFEHAGVQAADVDLLIYCGVGRGFVEPGNAYFCAKMMHMQCECFDVSDACMSYVRALEIAQAFFATRKHHCILVVNAECAVYEYGYPELFKIRSLEQLRYTFPAYTIGEAVTATLVAPDGNDWRFTYDSNPALANLCTIPAEGFRDFVGEDETIEHLRVGRFFSFGTELFRVAVERLSELCYTAIESMVQPDLWIPHAAAKTPCVEIANRLGLEHESVYYKIFGTHGNLASASIPTAMWSALSERKLQRGMNVALVSASAGMSFAVVTFTY